MSALRKCKKCGEQYPEEQYPLAGRKIKLSFSGTPYRRHICSKCYYSSKNEARLAKLQLWNEYKKTLRCNRCGLADHRVLDFHHKDPSQKEFNLSIMAGRNPNFQTLLDEVSKCEVLCSNCHRIHHYEERFNK
jgi:hypothetical protein